MNLSSCIDSLEVDNIEDELCEGQKAILKYLRENLKNYMVPESNTKFWIENIVKKYLILDSIEKKIGLKLWYVENPSCGIK